MLYTFITESEGSTVVEQFDSASMPEALRKWNEASVASPGFTEDQLFDSGSGGPTAVQDRVATWCFSGINGSGKFLLAHIVATAVPVPLRKEA